MYEIGNPYIGEVTRITEKDKELSETKQEAKRQLLELLKPLDSLKQREAKRLLAIIER